jgi:hypothetical protein
MPMFYLGNASGHDFEFHLGSWMDAGAQWREGVVYPHWAEQANWGFGEPRFVFYPPASWMLGAAIGCVLPWRIAPVAFIWLILLFAGGAMWQLAREWFPDHRASAAAALFAVNPYHLVIVYYRSDFAELIASALFPLLAWGAWRVWHEGWRGVPLLAVVFATIWLSNAPAAVIATYSLVLLLAVGSILRRSLGPVITGGAAMIAGFGLAAIYILPAAWEQRWVQISQVISENLHPYQNFLFTRASDPEFVLFNWKVSSVALGTILITAIAAVIFARQRRKFPWLWWTFASLGAVSVFLMFAPSMPFWRHLPELQFVQFPWRWLVPLSLVFAIFVAAAMGQSRRRWAWWLAFLLALGATGAAMAKDAWWDQEDVKTLEAAIRSGLGYEGTDEYAPLGCNHYSLPQNAPRIAEFDAISEDLVPIKDMRLHIEQWSAEHKVFSADARRPVTLALRLVNYPAWEAQVDGREVGVESRPESAQMLLHLAKGSHRVEMRFRQTWDRTAGAALSALAAIGLLAFTIATRRRTKHPEPPMTGAAHS